MHEARRGKIRNALLGICKEAQFGGSIPAAASGNPRADAYAQLADVHMRRGVARGVKNVIPGLVDAFVGMPAGVLNGLGHGLVNAVTGYGNFKDGFSEGYAQSADFTKEYMSDPIRRAEMRFGGNAMKDSFDRAQKYYENELRKMDGPDADCYGGYSPAYKERQKALAQMAGVEDGVAAATEYGIDMLMGGGGLSGVKQIPNTVSRLAAGAAGAGAPLAGFNAGRASAANRFGDLAGEWRGNAEMANRRKDADVVKWMIAHPDLVDEYVKRNAR